MVDSKNLNQINQALIDHLQSQFESIAPRRTGDYTAIEVSPDELIPLCKHLKSKHQFSMLMDVTGIDWDQETPRFSAVYHLLNPSKMEYIRILSHCASNDTPEMPSIAHIWAAGDWHERETYDMLGIKFTGHPNLKRILMWDDYPYFPLRKEFPLAGIETELPAADVAERTQETVKAAPMMGGPFHAIPGNRMSQAEPRAKDQSWSEKNPKKL